MEAPIPAEDPRLHAPLDELELPPDRRDSDQTAVSALTHDSNSLFVPTMYPSLTNLPSIANLEGIVEGDNENIDASEVMNDGTEHTGTTTLQADNRRNHDSWVSFTSLSRTSLLNQSDAALKSSIRSMRSSINSSIAGSHRGSHRGSGVLYKEKSDASFDLAMFTKNSGGGSVGWSESQSSGSIDENDKLQDITEKGDEDDNYVHKYEDEEDVLRRMMSSDEQHPTQTQNHNPPPIPPSDFGGDRAKEEYDMALINHMIARIPSNDNNSPQQAAAAALSSTDANTGPLTPLQRDQDAAIVSAMKSMDSIEQARDTPLEENVQGAHTTTTSNNSEKEQQEVLVREHMARQRAAEGGKQLTPLEREQEAAVTASMQKQKANGGGKQLTPLEREQEAAVTASMEKQQQGQRNSTSSSKKQRTQLEQEQDAAVTASMEGKGGGQAPGQPQGGQQTTRSGMNRLEQFHAGIVAESQELADIEAPPSPKGGHEEDGSSPNSRRPQRVEHGIMEDVEYVGAFPIPLPALNRGQNLQPRPQSRPGAFGGGPRGSLESLEAISFSAVGNHPTGNSSTFVGSSFATSSFAASTATAPSRTTMRVISDSALVSAQPVEEENPEQVFSNAQEIDVEGKEVRHKRYRKIGIALVVVAVLAAILGLVFGIRSSNSQPVTVIVATPSPSVTPTPPPSLAPSMAPSNSLAELLSTLPDYTLERLVNSSSPQTRAYNWLYNHQNITRLPEWRKEQLFALATVFYALEGPEWPEYASSRWLDDTKSECLWFASSHGYVDRDTGNWIETLNYEGLWGDDQCNARGDVKTIHLNFMNLGDKGTPHLPPEVALLTSLENLDLSFNGIRANLDYMLPSEVAEMTSLNLLHLGFNQLTGTLPTWIGALSKLAKFDMLLNSLTGPIPTEIGSMDRLVSLSLDANSLSGNLPTELTQLDYLTKLSLSGNDLEGSIPTELGRLSWLELISMLRCRGMSGALPSELGLATSLETLLMDGIGLSGSLPSELGRLKFLTRLHLRDNAFSGVIPPFGANVQELLLDHNKLVGQIPSELGLMESLEELSVATNALRGPIPNQLGMLSNLRELNVAYNLLSSSIPARLSGLTSLEVFNISHNPSMSGTIPPEFANLATAHSLHTVDILGNENFEGEIPQDLCYLEQESCTMAVSARQPQAQCSLQFDCWGPGSLCGCSNCVCSPIFKSDTSSNGLLP